MEFVVILLGIALVLSLAFNFGFIGGKPAAANTITTHHPIRTDSKSADADARAHKLESELDKRRKELEELRKTFNENKEELKSAKKKLHDLKEADKSGDDLKKARAEVERQASIQLDATRAELATALADMQKLKTELELKGKKREAAPVEKKAEEAPKQEVVIQKVIRELSEAEKERITRLEAQSANDRKKANELDREYKSLKAKFDKHVRDTKAVYADANLARDKFRAVEKRLNRTLLETDLMRRALFDLEKKTGVTADRTLLTAEEIADSDAKISEKHAAEDKAAAEARARLEASEASAAVATEAAEPAAAPVTTTPTA